jgi:hypothetical protein
MSNSLAVATVTAALRWILGEALVTVPGGGVNTARVTTLRPDMLANADGDARGINVFLYQVTGNGSWGNAALPARRSDGTVVARPEAAIDLHYLFTFSGDETALEPQRMLGAAVTALCTRPVLSRALLREIVRRAVAEDPGTWLQFSDLVEQIDLVRFIPLSLNLEELSKLWSTFIGSPYRLSITYQACVVLLDGDLTPQPALPVLTRGIDAAALNLPVVTRVVADADPTGPIVPGALLRIEGRQLRGTAGTRIRLDDVEVPVPGDALTGTRITVTLPAGTRAGVRSLQVVHPRMIGTPPVERSGAESEAAPVVVRPVVTGTVSAALDGVVSVVTVPVAPAVGRIQRVLLSLNEHHPPEDRAARAYTFVAAPPTPPAPGQPVPESSTSVTVRLPGVAAGTYLVRVQVDGAQSVLAVGPDGRFDTPRVTLP